ncbi:MAG: ribbon-helix-helix protein, CopG family [Acidobacteriia bacterium]|nr:ribbon-helix-helix protein, CopG family [Terriglobia bacterium]MYC67897.1 ribbon-helix-helix protein, CopG family [Terriglobia bacterium]
MSSAAVSTTVKIDPEMHERMKRLAARRRRTKQWLMRDAIREYVEREEARDAWQEYRETGLHANAEEVLAWLDTWGGESETAAPACHE